MSYLSSFIRLTWLSVSACPIFVAVTEREIGVRTHRRTVPIMYYIIHVPINANFWRRVQHPRPYCTTITSGSVLFWVLYLPHLLTIETRSSILPSNQGCYPPVTIETGNHFYPLLRLFQTFTIETGTAFLPSTQAVPIETGTSFVLSNQGCYPPVTHRKKNIIKAVTHLLP